MSCEDREEMVSLDIYFKNAKSIEKYKNKIHDLVVKNLQYNNEWVSSDASETAEGELHLIYILSDCDAELIFYKIKEVLEHRDNDIDEFYLTLSEIEELDSYSSMDEED